MHPLKHHYFSRKPGRSCLLSQVRHRKIFFVSTFKVNMSEAKRSYVWDVFVDFPIVYCSIVQAVRNGHFTADGRKSILC